MTTLTETAFADDGVRFVRNRALHVAIALSVLVHVAVLWGWHPDLRPTFNLKSPSDRSGPLQLRLEPEAPKISIPPSVPDADVPAKPPAKTRPVPRKQESPPPKLRPSPPARPAPPERMTQPAPPAATPEYAVPDPAPPSPPPPVPPPVTEAAPRAAVPGGDLSSHIAARRRARQGSETSPPRAPVPAEESEAARANRIAEANLGVGRTPSYGQDLTGGGVFQIKRLGYDDAEYLFYGWNVDIRRNATQLVTVRKGAHADIRKAVVRSMIDIIRRHEQGDFLWESRRLGRNVYLSARPGDDAGLEDFLMKEFFDDPARSPASRAP